MERTEKAEKDIDLELKDSKAIGNRSIMIGKKIISHVENFDLNPV